MAAVRSLLILALIALPSWVWACPACVGQQKQWDFTIRVLGILIIFPFLVAFFVIRAIRKASRDD